MTTKFQMQGVSSTDGTLRSWLSLLPDWGGVNYAGPGTPSEIALSSGGFATTSGALAGEVTTASGEHVLTASGARVFVAQRPGLLSASGSRVVTAGGARVTI